MLQAMRASRATMIVGQSTAKQPPESLAKVGSAAFARASSTNHSSFAQLREFYLDSTPSKKVSTEQERAEDKCVLGFDT